MAKLYPPYVEGTIPAISGTTFVVPFSMNRAVSKSEVNGMYLKVKRINSSDIVSIISIGTGGIDFTDCTARFPIPSSEQSKFLPGQYYRVQLAYVNNSNEVGYYSETSVVKYTSAPSISIQGLSMGYTNIHIYDYVVEYQQISDPTEKMYSACLYLEDGNGNIIYESGEKPHDTLNDVEPSSAIETFSIIRDLNAAEIYKIYARITTSNGLVVDSPQYRIIQKDNGDILYSEMYNINISAISNYEDGAVDIKLSSDVLTPLSGNFVIARAEVKKKYKIKDSNFRYSSPAKKIATEIIEPEAYEWEFINKFGLKAEVLTNYIIKDFVVEQGKTYIYCIQQYNNSGLYSNKKYSNEVNVDFEDLFLLDKDRQLKIKFNPKVSSMKENVLDTKVNTIGSKYPFITRNGNVYHKEFNISGLISYQMDDNNNFMNWEDLNLDVPMTDIVSENITAERKFKLEVLQWLNNGKPKVLKSSTEGNYIVYLMNVSLSPQDTLGRMLHDFSCSATEIANYDYDALASYDFIKMSEPDMTVRQWKTTLISKADEIEYPIYEINLKDLNPGTEFFINGKSFYVGATGAYHADYDEDNPITSFELSSDGLKTNPNAVITYQTKNILTTKFDKIEKIYLEDVPARQFINVGYSNNLAKYGNDIKQSIAKISRLKLVKRGLYRVYVGGSVDDAVPLGSTLEEASHVVLYRENKEVPENKFVSNSMLDEMNLYEIYRIKPDGYTQIVEPDGKIYYRATTPDYQGVEKIIYADTGCYFDPLAKKIFKPSSADIYDVKVNGDIINLEDIEEIEYGDEINYESIHIGDGVMAEITYLKQIVEYSCENNNRVVEASKNKYLTAKNKHLSTRAEYSGNTYSVLGVEKAYEDFLEALTARLEEEE